MSTLRDNRSEKTDCGHVVRDHLAQVHITYGTPYVVADSALYSADNLHKLDETGTQWITRVPAPLTEAQTVLAQADPETMPGLQEG